jgi:hypothetical protein
MGDEVTYFIEPGMKNTVQTLLLAREKAEERKINKILVASTTGYTIQKALEIFKATDKQFIVVGGRRDQFPEDLHNEIKQRKHIIIFNSEQSFKYPELVWETLRRFSEGMKVCVEMTLMISDLDLLPIGVEVIAIAGTGRVDFPAGGGADTAIICETVKSRDFFKLDLPQSKSKMIGRKIKEIICKPR